MTITKGQVLRYVLLPQIRPRMGALFGTGFAVVPYLAALVLLAVRLLPVGHPYSNPANIGRFGLRHVLGEAAGRLVFSIRNIDQIIMFGMILAGMVLFGLQLLMLGIGLFIQPVMAQVTTNELLGRGFGGFFLTQEPQQDLAHIMLDLVFGVKGMFHSCIAENVACQNIDGKGMTTQTGANVFGTEPWPYPIHEALHQLFTVYSVGLLVVAVIIALYFMVTVVAETAQTGTAFGKRFNKVWAPLRIVMAFGLLVPIGQGLNTAQFIVLYAAKFGTGFASNGWILFNETLNDAYLGDVEKLVAEPKVPEVGAFLQFMFVADTCRWAQYYLRSPDDDPIFDNSESVRPRVVKDIHTPPFVIDSGTTYDSLLAWLKGSNVATIRFGIPDQRKYPLYRGHLAPTCGEINFVLTDVRQDKTLQPGVHALQEFYFNTIKKLWYGPTFGAYAVNYIKNADPQDGESGLPVLSAAERRQMLDQWMQEFQQALDAAVAAQEASGRWQMDENLRKKGWAAAAIWYNRIAEMNGAVTTAVFKIPMPAAYPASMEYVREKKLQYDQNLSLAERYRPVLAGKNLIPFGRAKKHIEALALYEAYMAWDDGVATSAHTARTNNIIIDVINALFGTEGLFNMRKNTDVHPLAQLSALGKSLVDSSINNIGYAAVAGGAGGVLGATLGSFFGVTGKTAAGFLITFAMVGLTAGFILFYIVPFLPFIYFFFAFGGWIKGIFEAMVGAPLWALAHITIDGEGLPGKSALSGYMLIFEIFLRPILTLFGFLASIIIFAALVQSLNEIFALVTSNVAGFDVGEEAGAAIPTQIRYYRAPIDEFFFTAIYAVIVYMMGMSSFKMIDLVPNQILRWMGQSVSTFGDQREDPAQGLTQFAQIGAQQGLESIKGGLQGVLNLIPSGR